MLWKLFCANFQLHGLFFLSKTLMIWHRKRFIWRFFAWSKINMAVKVNLTENDHFVIKTLQISNLWRHKDEFWCQDWHQNSNECIIKRAMSRLTHQSCCTPTLSSPKSWHNTGYSFLDRLRNCLHKFTWIVLSVLKLNKLGKFW